MAIGELIRQKLDEEKHTVVWLSKKLACSRTNVYKIFEKEHLDTLLLMRISVILGFDFFKVLSDCYRKEAGGK